MVDGGGVSLSKLPIIIIRLMKSNWSKCSQMDERSSALYYDVCVSFVIEVIIE